MTTLDDIFGQTPAVTWLRGALGADRLPHGLVFAGPVGVGKGTTALALAGLFLCENPHEGNACGSCASCRAMTAGSHPDYHRIYRQLIRLDKQTVKARDLVVDVIRVHLLEPASRKANLGRGKVFVIEEAELMNPAAQNALLKTLEEPAGRSLIILLTDQPDALLPTIRSRSQTLRFAPLDEKTVVRELGQRGVDQARAVQSARLARGSLGVALRWIEDGVIEPAGELIEQIDGLFAGLAPDNLPAWFKKSADAYAEKQLARDSLGSKDAATREGLGLYLNLAAEHVRRRLATLDAPGDLEQACAVIDAIVRSETYLDANVNVPVIFQQLAATLGRQAVA